MGGLLMFTLAIITCLFWLFVLVDATLGMRRLPMLQKVVEDDVLIKKGPLISIIVAAKNEETDIEASLRSQLKQTYKNIEWIVVNDRSTDKTGAIIDNLAKEDDRITPVHIKDLPDAWLGKNHALYTGYRKAKGDYLLFTDGDIYFHKDVIAKSLTFFQNNKIDHLTLTPNMNVTSFWTKAFVTFFLFGFSYFKRPWKANDDKSKVAIGIGAFNLLSREAYEAIGTHRKIAMRPDDDLMLGVTIKQNGRKQRVANAIPYLEVAWYRSLKEAIIGLEKNTFAGLFYSYFMVLFSISGIFISQIWPFVALFVTEGATRFLYGVVILLLFFVYQQTANVMAKGALKYFVVFPISSLIFMYCIARATILTTIRGGIVWRGTFYPLHQLKKDLHK
ncbi:glycosyl transferase [Anaerobacillus arseniciselenatis]|uniref:Glycosyl transferase n=2 Tax=Anaerobacillus arseniciselenatis TaxID=85682 RepID=A0A1S2LTU6_9BACI|nr:glycosyl transferase [Anaerobacillus arseniciselenatis]